MDTDHRIKHLEMLQSVITRLSQQSFAVRGWSVTLVSVIFALVTARAQYGSALILLALAPAWIFWGLDAYYLSLERRYRELFVSTAQQLREPVAPGSLPFNMTPDSTRPVGDLMRAIAAPNVAAIPTVLTALVVGFWIIAVIKN